MINYDLYDTYYYSKPTVSNFYLTVVSKHPDFDGKPLKQYSVDGIRTVGVYGNEPFEVHFSNNSNEDVQTRISLDGIDVLTGNPADLQINEKMWLVRAGKTLHLKAWAENNKGGARFVFTNEENSVALHTSGNINHKGIIAAAVFTEKQRPIRNQYFAAASAPKERSGNATNYSASMDFMKRSKSASVGAGEYVEQKTHTVKGLNEPILNSIVRMRYVWWDDLVQKLKNQSEQNVFPSGFPAEDNKKFADLKETPRIVSSAASNINYSRIG